VVRPVVAHRGGQDHALSRRVRPDLKDGLLVKHQGAAGLGVERKVGKAALLAQPPHQGFKTVHESPPRNEAKGPLRPAFPYIKSPGAD
jgi:hypothetical protein